MYSAGDCAKYYLKGDKMSFENYFCNRYERLKREVEKEYYVLRATNETKIRLSVMTLDTYLMKIDGDIFLYQKDIEKMYEVNEKNFGGVATKVLQSLWDDDKKNKK